MEEKLPKGWVLTTLGEVFSWGSGGTPSRRKSSYYGGNIPWIKTGELRENIIYDTSEHITEEGLNNSSAKLFPKGSVAIAMYGATVGRLGILGVEAATNQACAVVAPNQFVESQYLYNYLLSQKENLISKAQGGAQPNISQTLLKAHPFPLPPLAEQKRIVYKLDAAFEKLQKANEALMDVPKLIEDFRKSVLYHAVTGKLLKKGTKLWQEYTLGKVAKWGSGGTPSRRNSSYYNGDIPWIKTGELGKKYIYDTKEKITEEAVKNSSAKIFPKGSVAIAMYGATIGKVSILGIDSTTNQACAVAIVDEEIITNEYLYYFLLSQKEKFISLGKGGAQPNISQTIIKADTVKLPPLSEQKIIVKKIKTYLNSFEQVEKSYQASLDEIEKIRNSILYRAFIGELVKQDPKDEPASALLEKIKEEKVLLEKAVKAQRKSRKPKKKMAKEKLSLQSIIHNNFKSKTFTFNELKEVSSNIAYEDLKSQLFLLLDKTKSMKGQQSLFDKEQIDLKMKFNADSGNVEFEAVTP